MQKTMLKAPATAIRSNRGITLLELMIVLVIVGILSAIGYPAYVDYSNRARRSDGKALLLDAHARMERFYFDNNAYTLTLGTGGLGYNDGTVTSAEKNYTLSAAFGPTGSINTSFLLTATPNAGLPFVDDDCGLLHIDSRSEQTVTPVNTPVPPTGKGTVAYCWGR